MSLPPSAPDPALPPGDAPAPIPARQSPALRGALRAAFGLAAFTAAFTALMAFTHEITRERIRAAVAEQQMRLIDEILPRAHYDNALLADMIDADGGSGGAVGRIWRARRGGEPVALVFETFASDGYGGRIELIAALDIRGEGQSQVRGVRVSAHRETPGLGDYIDPAKDRDKEHPWIAQFSGVDAGLPIARWAVRKDGGDFDYRTGATVSARAVTRALGHGLAWVNARKDALFAAPAGARPGADGQTVEPVSQ
ncbi:MAG: RnfABCDGE type electron transport complex subunit G [Azoarcus sp.]|jgi:electron transport complex protein RnfG|nr:RnfABCDGE type electron transport complex subunit G [Azoarcus sp.]